MADLHSTVFGSKSQDDISCPRHLYQELSSLIDRLRETVEQLDRDSMSRSGGAEHETDCAEKEKEKNEPPFKGEYRSFYLSPFELGHEEKMLAVYQAEDLDDLLLSTCIMLESQSQLLMRIQPDEQIPTFYVKEWGTLVYHIYLRLQSVYEVIHAMKLVSTSKK